MADQSDTELEILSQPEVWRRTLAGVDVAETSRGWLGESRRVIVTGCGSTHYLAMTIAALLRDVARVHAHATPASELLTDSGSAILDPANSTLLVFSRSGTTTETLLAVENFRAVGGQNVLAVTCYPNSPLAAQADRVLTAEAAQEASVAQTRSFTSMLLLGQALVAATAGLDYSILSDLPQHADASLDSARAKMRAWGIDRSKGAFYFLGAGVLFGVASEAMLKLKEMSLTASEAYHPMEFRHGPMSMCDPSATVVALVDPRRVKAERAVLSDLVPTGATVVELGVASEIAIPAELPVWASPVLYLLPLQLLALERALSKGLDPDNPRHLTAVIHLNNEAEPA